MAWLHDETRPATTRASAQGALAAVDRAGHVFVWETLDPVGLSAFADGKRIVRFPDVTQSSVWPDPGGARILIRTRTGVALYGLDGTRRWELATPALWTAVWLDAATIAVVAPGGILRIDAETGTVSARRCGWEFQLSPTPLPIGGRAEPLCTRP